LPIILLWLIIFILSHYISLAKQQKALKYLLFYLKENNDTLTNLMKSKYSFNTNFDNKKPEIEIPSPSFSMYRKPEKKVEPEPFTKPESNIYKEGLKTNALDDIDQKLSLLTERFKTQSSSLEGMGLIDPDRYKQDLPEINSEPEKATAAEINDIDLSNLDEYKAEELKENHDFKTHINPNSSFEISQEEDPLANLFGYSKEEKKNEW